MNRRIFCSIVAAAVAAPGVLWRMVKPKPATYPITNNSGYLIARVHLKPVAPEWFCSLTREHQYPGWYRVDWPVGGPVWIRPDLVQDLDWTARHLTVESLYREARGKRQYAWMNPEVLLEPPPLARAADRERRFYRKWSNKVNPPLTADQMRERLRRLHAEADEAMARDVLGNVWGFPQEVVDREIARMKSEL